MDEEEFQKQLQAMRDDRQGMLDALFDAGEITDAQKVIVLTELGWMIEHAKKDLLAKQTT